ncbi:MULTISPECIES: hypothetical protein [unclassified Microcoleus]|uniref:hypothetical protein n=1 Tax=unclassified Microcoleus TaxID=2642155 RepID=UPI0025F70AF8|nr:MULTISPECIES: hypothetical protein [unclassified Microcoleus]
MEFGAKDRKNPIYIPIQKTGFILNLRFFGSCRSAIGFASYNNKKNRPIGRSLALGAVAVAELLAWARAR